MSNVFGGTHRKEIAGGNPLEREVDPRVLEKTTVRQLRSLLHPDHYKGHDPELAQKLFQWLGEYVAR